MSAPYLYRKTFQKDDQTVFHPSRREREREREKTNPELLKEKSGKELKEKDEEDLTRVVRLWNDTCAECNEPTLAWLQSDVDRLATSLIEVIHNLRLSKLSDDELSKRLRLLCGTRSASVFERMGRRFSAYNADGLVIETFANYGPRVWRAVNAELSDKASEALLGPPLIRDLKDYPI
jgi:hypothetical protein